MLADRMHTILGAQGFMWHFALELLDRGEHFSGDRNHHRTSLAATEMMKIEK